MSAENTEMQQPALTVVICNYNYERFLSDALESVLAQTVKPIQIIVVDDGSTDSSRDIIEAYRSKQIEVIYKENGGQISAYNAAIPLIQGEYVIFLDSDDKLLPNAAHEVIASFKADECVVKVHYRLEMIDAAGHRIGSAIPTKLAEGDVSWIMLKQGCLYNSAPGSGNAYKVSVLKEKLAPLPVDVQDRHGADFFAVHGMGLIGHIATANQGKPLAEYRVHRVADQATLGFGNAAKLLSESDRLKKRYARFQKWIHERWGDDYQLPQQVTDFSIEKQKFAADIFNAKGYFQGLSAGIEDLGPLVRSIVLRPSSPALKAALVVWALAVLALPRPAGIHLARYVCNPASRSQ